MKKNKFFTVAVFICVLVLCLALSACLMEHEHSYGEDGNCTKCGETNPMFFYFPLLTDNTCELSDWTDSLFPYLYDLPEEVSIPSEYEGKPVSSIKESLFKGSPDITKFVIPSTVKKIGAGVFTGARDLVEISIPDSVVFIGADAFYEVEKLKYNEYDGLKYLGNEKNPYVYLVGVADQKLITATVHPSCRIIGSRAFSDCTFLTQVILSDSVVNVNSNAFEGCDKLRFTEENGLKYLGSKKIRIFALWAVFPVKRKK